MNQFLRQAGYSLDDTDGIWFKPGYFGIPYSDGDEVEKRIASIVSNASDITILSTELRQYCTDWPSLYHLSGTRANLLRPFEHKFRGASVLEIGAGCGAITRYLGECGANVLALEGSQRRAAITRSRTRDLANVTVLAEKFDVFQCDCQFDCITLIGVLEYANLFTQGANPAQIILEHVHSLLRPGGVLIIAIENQLGLKYFAGANEDHLGIPMYGIEGRYSRNEPQTFGRVEISNLIKKAGFASDEFLAPFPDYKLPSSIITERGFLSVEFDAAALASQSVWRDKQLPPILAFSPELVWTTVVNNNLAIDLSNSFLIVAKTAKSDEVFSPKILAWHFTTERRKDFCKYAEFIENEVGEIEVRYTRLDHMAGNPQVGNFLRHSLPERDSYKSGKVLSQKILEVVTRDGWQINELTLILLDWLNFLVALAAEQGQTVDLADPSSQLPGHFFDYIPQNIIVADDGSVHIIDDEWYTFEKLEIGFLVFRALFILIANITKFGRSSEMTDATYLVFVSRILDSLGWVINEEVLEKYINFTCNISTEVEAKKYELNDLVRWLQVTPLRFINLGEAVSDRDSQIGQLSQSVSDRDSQISQLSQSVSDRDSQISQLSQSVSDRDSQISQLSQSVSDRDSQISQLSQSVSDRDSQISQLSQSVSDRDSQIGQLSQSVSDRDSQISQLSQSVSDRDSQISQLSQSVSDRDSQISQLSQSVSDRDSQIGNLKTEIVSLNQDIFNLNEQFNRINHEFNLVVSSRSWSLTRPLRFIKRLFTDFHALIKEKKIKNLIVLVWQQIPLDAAQKRCVKAAIYKLMPSLAFRCKGYIARGGLDYLGESVLIDRGVIDKVFDSEYYLLTNSDLVVPGFDPKHHYLSKGWREGRNPHPLFNTIYYLQQYPDVMEAGINPLEHYLLIGWLEGRDTHPVFDASFYVKQGWYSVECGISPLEYYLKNRCASNASQLASLDFLLPRIQTDSFLSDKCMSIKDEGFAIRPLISILLPTYNTPEIHLKACLDSVLAQDYLNWELCISDDGSTLAETQKVIEDYKHLDSRIRVIRLGSNSGISAATNAALSMSTGEYVTMLDHDDMLEPDALQAFVKEVNSYPDADAIYSDQDRVTSTGETVDIYYKPDWSPELMCGVMYVGHLLMVRRSLAINIGGFNSKFDGVQDFEFMLRVSEHSDKIRHIPRVLYHWKMIPGSIANDGDAKGKIEPLQCAAINAHLVRLGLKGSATPHPIHAHRAVIIPPSLIELTTITVVISQITNPAELESCLDSLVLSKAKVEIFIIGSHFLFTSHPSLEITFIAPSNFHDKNIEVTDQLNNIIEAAAGDFVLILERPITFSPGWVDLMVMYSERPQVGLISPMVIASSGLVAEAGLLLHPSRGIAPALYGWDPRSDGQAGSLSCTREISVASAACSFSRKSTLTKIGRFDPLYRSLSFQIADLSLRALSLGMRNLCLPTVMVTVGKSTSHYDVIEQSIDKELFVDRWSNFLTDGDPYHNINYSPENGGYCFS